MKIALIDHNDSFTYNIIDLLKKFNNITVTVIPYENLDTFMLSNFDKIILSPGPELPKKYPKTIQLINEVYTQKPILGICLGHQLLCEFFGHSLYNLEEVKHGVEELITIDNQILFYKNLPKNIQVGLYHSWAVNLNKHMDNLIVTAKNKDGVVMSMQHRFLPIFGVQYHVESFLTPLGKSIMKNFLDV